MSGVEVLSFLKKALGIVIKDLEEKGVLAAPSFSDHEFRPEVEVTDAGLELPVEGFVYSIKAHEGYAPVKFNLDRPVTPTEYSVVHPGVIKLIQRRASKVHLRAPMGQVGRVTVEALRGA